MMFSFFDSVMVCVLEWLVFCGGCWISFDLIVCYGCFEYFEVGICLIDMGYILWVIWGWCFFVLCVYNVLFKFELFVDVLFVVCLKVDIILFSYLYVDYVFGLCDYLKVRIYVYGGSVDYFIWVSWLYCFIYGVFFELFFDDFVDWLIWFEDLLIVLVFLGLGYVYDIFGD